NCQAAKAATATNKPPPARTSQDLEPLRGRVPGTCPSPSDAGRDAGDSVTGDRVFGPPAPGESVAGRDAAHDAGCEGGPSRCCSDAGCDDVPSRCCSDAGCEGGPSRCCSAAGWEGAPARCWIDAEGGLSRPLAVAAAASGAAVESWPFRAAEAGAGTVAAAGFAGARAAAPAAPVAALAA